jgi:SAM-dependent methyltransferase
MEPTEENLRAWEDAHGARSRPEPVALPPVVQLTLGDLKKKRVLHLRCGTGEATAALAELGAVATGVDPRPALLEKGRERWPKILWVDGDPQSLPRQLRRGRFDLVYSGEGVLDGLQDLDGWAAGIVSVLREHGELLVFDDHPVADCVDGLLRWRSDYFRDPYDPDRLWRIGQVVSALARAGLRVAALEEYPGGTSRRRHDRRIPATFLLYARRAD